MRTRLSVFLATALLTALPAGAQETRGNINGTVQDSSGVIPGATVTIINVDTGQTQTLVTNASGYFEAPLLQAGPYRVTVDMAGFKGLTQSGITLSVGQSVTLKLTLEVGAISERIDVSAKASLLDTTSVSSGQNFDQALISGLPMASNMPILLARFAQGVVSPTTQVQVISGQIDGPTNAAGSVLGGVGGFNYTVDGATNAGSSRRIASSPNADMIEEMRVETSNFDAGKGSQYAPPIPRAFRRDLRPRPLEAFDCRGGNSDRARGTANRVRPWHRRELPQGVTCLLRLDGSEGIESCEGCETPEGRRCYSEIGIDGNRRGDPGGLPVQKSRRLPARSSRGVYRHSSGDATEDPRL